MSALVANSVIAYGLGMTPAVFAGPVLCVLGSLTLVVWGTYILATKADHAEANDEEERVRNFAAAVRYARLARAAAHDSRGSDSP